MVSSQKLKAGQVLLVGRAASVQFTSPIMFRLIRVLPRVTYAGWVWLEGYELGTDGEAVEHREIFVQEAGLRPIQITPPPGRGRRNRAPVAGMTDPAGIPAPRR